MNDGGPAFPIPQDSQAATWSGMTLRDYFAAAALPCMIAVAQAQEWEKSGPEWRDALSEECFKYADAMLTAREAK